MKFADSFSYLPSNQSIYCFDLGGNVVLRIETIYSPNARIYFTDTNNPSNNIAIPPGIVVRDTTRNLILPQACFQPLGYYLILWYYSYEITYNNQVVIVLSNQEQQSVQLADGLVHYLD
ncbi:uncharacterized protein OCT59_024346 [Rhizophagus irregularis]|uniref:Uncharacterized protein n=1 Tax=Rhizophagus irregularis (strain DAOM 181602 / DAOM 197198 / MUCL 43194) TaxID=747089 RepID=A0A2P4PAQ9_RHIID|nr:hypothetical protein GLOIN_2v1695973 [Rhizophagus irregularis DAOM 181602=DAOM 197198]POG62482.1 hypothetical protein GLOIN_2v1695973 [Rhizophagus irregularis DAOM 181602=DAOM 197198]UZO03946.1 hypothetical protein OCT59_024346 [Rhizophagus irregularis]GET58693.1 hypothetical protein GLOIN_2v1695973 [Rhizophagus irregularis DAOM 181602=DAOM 197198]CAG8546176.1 4016_t:CDS:1 [Rhizophagus irregularis]|eukprot:XP_025169348.1 hypothetical protein GLOIN_2v1695973 [Rhizophagus irregularis DAOM 181602=DAOM 197198]